MVMFIMQEHHIRPCLFLYVSQLTHFSFCSCLQRMLYTNTTYQKLGHKSHRLAFVWFSVQPLPCAINAEHTHINPLSPVTCYLALLIAN